MRSRIRQNAILRSKRLLRRGPDVRDLLASDGLITTRQVEAEVNRLRGSWASLALQPPSTDRDAKPVAQAEDPLLPPPDQIDAYDRALLAQVLRICRSAQSLSDAGRQLFAVSRKQRRSSNDADRLRKYLMRFDIRWEQLHSSSV